MPSILTETVEDLRILEHRTSALRQRKELVELPLNKTGRNVMGSKSRPEFLPINNMTSGECGAMVLPS